MTIRERILKVRRQLSGRVLPGLRYLPQSRIGLCPCCERPTVILALSARDELRFCVRCKAGLRYWMLARYLRESTDLQHSDMLELDGHSPLRFLLSRRAGSHTRTYWSPTDPLGTLRADGARCEDITGLTFDDESFDVIVSSEVLEHVPDLDAAMRESARVLRPGGAHIFTVPPCRVTRQRARFDADGEIEHLTEPSYHSDPLTPQGILAFWDLGIEDGGDRFSQPSLELQVVAGPEGRDGRVVWCAQKTLTEVGEDTGEPTIARNPSHLSSNDKSELEGRGPERASMGSESRRHQRLQGPLRQLSAGA